MCLGRYRTAADKQTELDGVIVTLTEPQIKLQEAQIKTEARFRETDECFRQTDERIDKLVGAISEFIRTQNGGTH